MKYEITKKNKFLLIGFQNQDFVVLLLWLFSALVLAISQEAGFEVLNCMLAKYLKRSQNLIFLLNSQYWEGAIMHCFSIHFHYLVRLFQTEFL
jgi:hypothetical protein